MVYKCHFSRRRIFVDDVASQTASGSEFHSTGPQYVSKVKLYIGPVKPAPEGDGVFSGACWR